MFTQRNTLQRRLVRSIFEGARSPLTVQQTHRLARLQMPTIGCATVYRCIAHLLEDGWLKTIHLPTKSVCYERTGLAHHHYFLCEACDTVITFEKCVDGLKELSPPGCSVTSHEIVLYGHCHGCLNSESASQKHPHDGDTVLARNKNALGRREP
jgi:Fur family ferric uptake transcriptional regulator